MAARQRISRTKKEQEQEERRKLIGQLECDNKNILDNMRHSKEQDYDLIIRRRECILALAENYERLHELGEYKEPIDTICATICNLVREHGLFVTENWIHDVLPKKYKLPMLFLSLYNVHELRNILPPLVPSPPVPTAIEEQERRKSKNKKDRSSAIHPLKQRSEGWENGELVRSNTHISTPNKGTNV